MKKICLMGASAPLYRLAIYKAMRNEFDCSFILAHSKNTKQFQDDALEQTAWVKNKGIFGSRLFYQPGSVRLSRKYDLLVLDCGMFCLTEWIILLRAKFRGQRTFLWTHGWYGRENWLKKIIKRINFALSSGVLLYGYYARDLMLKEGYSIDKLFVIHNSLNYQTQLSLRSSITKSEIFVNHFQNSDPVLIFVGRLTVVKKLDYLIESVDMLNRRGCACNLVIVGDGVVRAQTESMIIEKHLEGRVWMYGECYDERTNAELIYNADLCVSPGNVGLMAMHSMMFGTPVVSHNNFTRQMPEFEAIKEGCTGTFYEYGNIVSLADKIEYWLKNHPDRELIRKACFDEIDTSWTPEFEVNVMKKAFEG